LCKRIQTAVEEFGIEASPGEFARVGVSVGAATYPSSGESFDQLIISADKAMYIEKAWRKQRKPAATAAEKVDVNALLAPPPTAEEYVPRANAVERRVDVGVEDRPNLSGEMLVVELDETHVIATSSVN
jgi:GGDEF domain-containing protein